MVHRLIWCNLMCLTGIAEAGSCRIHRLGSEANKQLVHKSKKTSLEAFRRYAVCGDGCYPSPLLHGQCPGQSLSHGYLPYTAVKLIIMHA